MSAHALLGWRATGAYGLLGLPLAFAALPIYVQWPAFYAAHAGVSLAQLGGLLLWVRVADAVVDPWLGRWGGACLTRGRGRSVMAGAMVLLCAGFAALFGLPDGAQPHALAWGACALVVTSLAYSFATVLHQTWAARLSTGSAADAARWMSARETAALGGVILASVLPSQVGWPMTVAVLSVLAAGAWWALASVPVPRLAAAPATMHAGPRANIDSQGLSRTLWRSRHWRWLIGVYVVNGIANAVPATLVLFFVRDRLQDGAWEGVYLAVYFLAAALSMPVWTRLIARVGLMRAWQAAMFVAILSFVGSAWLGAGDRTGFLVVCVATGFALGADLVAPPALVLAWLRRESRGASDASDLAGLEGLAFGWWGAATKLAMALAAGLVLPLLGHLGYAPGWREPHALRSLTWMYAGLPCVLKLLALVGVTWGLGRSSAALAGSVVSGDPPHV